MSKYEVRQANGSHVWFRVLMTDSPSAEEIAGARREARDFARTRSMDALTMIVVETVGGQARNTDKFYRGVPCRDTIG